MPGLTDPGAHAAAIGVCLALILAGIGLAPLTAAVIDAVRRRRQATRPMPAIGDDIHPDGTPYGEDEIEQRIRDYEGGDRG